MSTSMPPADVALSAGRMSLGMSLFALSAPTLTGPVRAACPTTRGEAHRGG